MAGPSSVKLEDLNITSSDEDVAMREERDVAAFIDIQAGLCMVNDMSFVISDPLCSRHKKRRE